VPVSFAAVTTKLLAIVAIVLVACGAPPTAPSVVEFREGGTGPGLVLSGSSICVGQSCIVTRHIQNVGNACATDVHATISMLDAKGDVLTTYDWVLIPSSTVVRPLQAVEVRFDDVPFAIFQATVRWRIAAGWRQVSCP
jgi:hypothetical protein